MNTTLSCDSHYIDKSIKFFPQVFCTVSTDEGNILECQIDIYKHTIADTESSIILYTYKPVNSEILNNDKVEHINSIFQMQI